MTPAELRSLIDADPSLAPLVAARYDGSIADALNARTGVLPWGVPWRDLATWAAGNGVRALLQMGAENTGQTPDVVGIRAICLTVLDNLRGSLGTTMLDLTSPHTTGLLDALISAGILTVAQKAELIAIGTLPASRVEIAAGEIGAVATADDVSRALEVD